MELICHTTAIVHRDKRVDSMMGKAFFNRKASNPPRSLAFCAHTASNSSGVKPYASAVHAEFREYRRVLTIRRFLHILQFPLAAWFSTLRDIPP